jgi:hypothetical protein
MNENQRAALVFSQACSALIEALGMLSENMQRQTLQQSIAYNKDAFDRLISDHGIDWNAAINTLQGY